MSILFYSQSLIKWTYGASDEDGFLLQSSNDSGSSWTTALSCSANTTSYHDNTVQWGESRWYRIYALNSGGQGPVSPTSSIFIRTPGVDVPALQTYPYNYIYDYSYPYAYNSSPEFTWTFSGSAQGSIDYFLIEVSNDSGSTWSYNYEVTSSQSSSMDTNATMSLKGYWYRITPHVNLGFYSNPSDILDMYVILFETSSLTPFIVDYSASFLSQLQTGSYGSCLTSSYPEWDGVFSINTVYYSDSINPTYGFLSQSINGNAVAVNDAGTYPHNQWGDDENCACLFWQVGNGYPHWEIGIACSSGDYIWYGTSSISDITNPAGTYVQYGIGDFFGSPTPASITIST